MGYDMVAVRTSPELGDSMQKLDEAYRRCRAIVCGDWEQEEPEMGYMTWAYCHHDTYPDVISEF